MESLSEHIKEFSRDDAAKLVADEIINTAKEFIRNDKEATENTTRTSREGRLDRGRRQPSSYSRTEQEVERGDYKKSFLVVFMIILAIGVIYLVIFSPVFKVDKITLNNTSFLDRAGLVSLIDTYKDNGILEKDTVTFLSGGLEQKIANYPGVEAVTITKKYPNTIAVSIKERAPVFVWQVNNNKYLVDDTGTIYANFDSRFKNTIVVVDTDNKMPSKIGESPVTTAFCSFIETMTQDFSAMTDEKINHIEVADTIDQFKLFTDSGWYAYFNIQRDPTDQLHNLVTVLDQITAKRTVSHILMSELPIKYSIC